MTEQKALSNDAVAFLVARGVSQPEIDAATKAGRLHLLVLEQLSLGGEPKYTQGDVAELSGLSPDELRRFWRALGFADVGPDDRLFTDDDINVLGMVTGSIAMGVTDIDRAIQLTRVYGSSMARVADAEVQALVARTAEESDRLAQLYALTGGGQITAINEILQHVWRRHLQAALRRQTMRDAETGGALAVGFCDLVGFTAMSQQLTDEELAAVVNRFEELAYDTVAAGGGRVVKMIGDEVMFVVDSPVVAAHVALALADAYADDESLSDVRVGLAYGPVLGIEGDFYGPVVNLASRIVNIAYPGTVVVSQDVADAVSAVEGADLEMRPLRPRYLKDIGRVPLFSVTRPGEQTPTWRGRVRSSAPPAARDVVKALLSEVVRRQLERRANALAAEADGGDGPGPEIEGAVERSDGPAPEVDKPT